MNSKTKTSSMFLLIAVLVAGTISMTTPSSFAAPVYYSYEEEYAQNAIPIDYDSYDDSYDKDPYAIDYDSYDDSYDKDPYAKSYNDYDGEYEKQDPYADNSYFEDE
ncbi:MAG: hypothetical protein MRJ93_13010 [Nitrososphaeraceae archaeon]|nr:hypothetical protein [Nitrososphaeraceae archaeon]